MRSAVVSFVFRITLVSAVLLFPSIARAEEESAEKDSAQKGEGHVIAVFSLSSVLESPTPEGFPLGSPDGESLKDLLTRMSKAEKDDSVKAIVVKLDGASAGSAQAEEIRGELKALIDAGKKVYIHSESINSTGSYALASGASRLSIVPTGDLWVTGVYAEQMYLRGLLDMIGVTPVYLTCGDYKSAAEMFTRKGPSEPAQENQDWLVDSLFSTIVKQIADGRGVSEEEATKWIDHGLFSAEEAKERGLIDAVEQLQDFEQFLKSEYGEKVKFDKRYGKKKPTEIDLSSPFGLFKFYADLLSGPKTRTTRKASVAIVYVEGPILPGSPSSDPFSFGGAAVAHSTPIRRALLKAADDDSVKAVVLRVNSPGGSAVASEIILDATKRVQDKKPLIVSMGDVAGSGGYYVACGTDTIFADKMTITGSIGVVGGKFATEDMWKKLGIHFQATQRGEKAGIMASGAPFSEEEEAQLQEWMNKVYEVFKGHVTASRGEKLKKEIEELAGGRVYTGDQAVELGLVDRLGGLQDAIAFAAEKGDVEDFEIRVIPRPLNFLELLFEDLEPKDDSDHLGLALRQAVPPAMHSELAAQLLPALKSLDPQRTSAVFRSLVQLRILREERIGLVMPEFCLSP